MRSALREVKLIATKVFLAGLIRGSAEKHSEILDPLHVVVLGLRSEFANRHVFDHAPAQRADGLVGREDAPVSSEVVATLNLKTGRVLALSSWLSR